MTPRRVSAIVYWLLNSGVWSLWMLALESTVLGVRDLGFVAALSFALWFAAGVGRALYTERKTAREAGRPRATIGRIADRPVELGAPAWDLATGGRFLTELAWTVVFLGVVGALMGRPAHFLPWGLPCLVAYAAARRVVPPFAEDRPRWRPSSGPIPGS